MREDSNHYAMQVLKELDNLLTKQANTVRNGLQAFEQQASQYQQQIEDYQHQYKPKFLDTPANSATPARRPTTAQPRPTLTPAAVGRSAVIVTLIVIITETRTIIRASLRMA